MRAKRKRANTSTEGVALGAADGANVGEELGVAEGGAVGTDDGEAVGEELGSVVGDAEGTAEGATVGVADGCLLSGDMVVMSVVI